MNRKALRLSILGVPMALISIIGWTTTPTPSATTAAASALDATTDDPSVITAWINQHFYADGDIDYSFLTGPGQRVDCINFFAQHSVQAYKTMGVDLDPTKIPPAPPLPPGQTYPDDQPGAVFDGTLDVNGNPRQCPPGDVAVNRPTVAEIQLVGGLYAYKHLRKPLCGDGGGNYCTQCGDTCTNLQSCFEHDCFLWSDVSTNTGVYEHAVGIQTDFSDPLYGMLTVAPIYYSPVSYSAEHGINQLWIQTGVCENWPEYYGSGQLCNTYNGASDQAVQSLEVGLYSYASSYSTNPQTVVFITQDGYYTHCFAGQGGDCCPWGPDAGTLPNGEKEGTDCWVASPTYGYMVNEYLSPSTPNGSAPQEISFQVWNGSDASPTAYPGWWVYMNGKVVGYYPPNAFIWPTSYGYTNQYGPMAYGPATYMQVGGEVYDTFPVEGQHSNVAMGTGVAPCGYKADAGVTCASDTGYGYAAYDRLIEWMDANGGYHSPSLTYNYTPTCEGDQDIPGVCGYSSGYWYNPAIDPGTPYGAYSLGLTGGPWDSTYFFFGGGQGQCVGGQEPPCPML